jgi:hypothetical protein
MMVGKLKFFTVHQGHLYAMSENGMTFRTTAIGNTGWVRVAGRITGNEPTDSEAYNAKQGPVDVAASTTSETLTLVPAKEDEVLVLGQVPDEPPQADEGGA